MSASPPSVSLLMLTFSLTPEWGDPRVPQIGQVWEIYLHFAINLSDTSWKTCILSMWLSLLKLRWMLPLKDDIFYIFLPQHFAFFSIPAHHPCFLPPTITPSPRWLWGQPVWNVIGIIPFSLIASAGECPIVCLPNPSEDIRHTFPHRGVLQTHAQACMG